MRSTMEKLMIKYIWVFFSLLLISCSQPTKECSNKPKIIVSLSPYDSWIQKIAGDHFVVEALVPSNFSCEEFSPSLKEISSLHKAKIWFCLGEGFEPSLITILKEKKIQPQIFSLGEKNEHIWLSPKRALGQLSTITKILKQNFPEFEKTFEDHFSKLEKELLNLDRELKQKLSPFRGKAILVSQPLLKTFCQDYGLIEIALENDSFPSPKKLQDLYYNLPLEKICLACLLPQVDNRSLELFAKKRMIFMVTFDPFLKNYEENLKELCQNIEKSLSHEERH